MPKVLVVFYGYTGEESSSIGEALLLLASVFWYYRKKMRCKLGLVMGPAVQPKFWFCWKSAIALWTFSFLKNGSSHFNNQ